MISQIRKYWYLFLKDQDVRLGGYACQAMQLRGFSSRPVHPKHLFDEMKTEYLQKYFRPDIQFLDIGSGVGTECISASASGARISCGVEYDMASLLTATHRAEKHMGQTSFFQLDLEAGCLPFADNSFDLVNFTNVLEHLHNREHILKEIRRVKKEDGVIVLSVPNSETSWKKKQESVGIDSRDDTDHKIEYTKESLVAELNQVSLKIVSDYIPTIPSFPWNGLIAMSAFLSPKLYRNLQSRKRDFVNSHPEESIGWIVVVE